MEQSFSPNKVATITSNFDQVIFSLKFLKFRTFKLVDNIFCITRFKLLIMKQHSTIDV